MKMKRKLLFPLLTILCDIVCHFTRKVCALHRVDALSSLKMLQNDPISAREHFENMQNACVHCISSKRHPK